MSEAQASERSLPQSKRSATPKPKRSRARKSSAAKKTVKSDRNEQDMSLMDKQPESDSLTNKQIVKLLNKGCTEREISAVTNIPQATVHRRIQRLKDDPEFIEFKSNKADYLEELQFKLASIVDHDLLKSMVSKRGMTDLAILEDKIRLMRGEATSITTIDIRALGIMVNATPPPEVIDIEAQDN